MLFLLLLLAVLFSKTSPRVSQVSTDAANVDRRACDKEDSRVLGCALRWHTTHRSVDDRTAPARCVYHAVPRDTPRRSQQLRQLIRRWHTGVVTGVVIILMLCIVIRDLGVLIVIRVRMAFIHYLL